MQTVNCSSNHQTVASVYILQNFLKALLQYFKIPQWLKGALDVIIHVIDYRHLYQWRFGHLHNSPKYMSCTLFLTDFMNKIWWHCWHCAKGHLNRNRVSKSWWNVNHLYILFIVEWSMGSCHARDTWYDCKPVCQECVCWIECVFAHSLTFWTIMVVIEQWTSLKVIA